MKQTKLSKIKQTPQDTLPPNRGSKKNVGGLTPLVPFINKLQLWEFNPFEKVRKETK